MRKIKRKRGFTLIELVVTVSIIAVLAAFVYSKMTRTISKAKDAKAVASIEALRKAAHLYFMDNEKSFSSFHEEGREDGDRDIFTSDLEKLVSLGYIEPRAVKVFDGSQNGYKDEHGISKGIASIEVGSIGTESSCGLFPTAGFVKLRMDGDGIGITVDSDTYDTGCMKWRER